jgi:putative peptidoglycan lipid II flippase
VLMAPRALGLGAVQVVFLVMTSLASTLATGAIAAFTFAFAVLQIPIGVIGVPLGIVLLPSLSRESALGDADAFRRLLVRALRLLAFVMVPITAIGFVVSADVTRLLFDYGATDEPLLVATTAALQAFLLGLTAHSLIAVLARAFYARQDTLTPVLAALVAVALDIAFAIVLVGPFGVVGLAGAIAIGAWVEAVILAVILRHREAGLGLGSVVRVGLVTTVLALLGAAAAFLVNNALVTAWGQDTLQVLVLVRLVAATAAGGLVVVAGAAALRMEELRTIVGVMADLIRRRGRP